ncbi:hypothetical protein BC829DRAFT_442706 [Chytridium lagenaria]|nr:hypothetical protein BC829DRAFT_442706 [Chytridium lagenaria]
MGRSGLGANTAEGGPSDSSKLRVPRRTSSAPSPHQALDPSLNVDDGQPSLGRVTQPSRSESPYSYPMLQEAVDAAAFSYGSISGHGGLMRGGEWQQQSCTIACAMEFKPFIKLLDFCFDAINITSTSSSAAGNENMLSRGNPSQYPTNRPKPSIRKITAKDKIARTAQFTFKRPRSPPLAPSPSKRTLAQPSKPPRKRSTKSPSPLNQDQTKRPRQRSTASASPVSTSSDQAVEAPKKIRRVDRGFVKIRAGGELGFVSVVFDGVRADGTAPWHREVLMAEGGESLGGEGYGNGNARSWQYGDDAGHSDSGTLRESRRSSSSLGPQQVLNSSLNPDDGQQTGSFRLSHPSRSDSTYSYPMLQEAVDAAAFSYNISGHDGLVRGEWQQQFRLDAGGLPQHSNLNPTSYHLQNAFTSTPKLSNPTHFNTLSSSITPFPRLSATPGSTFQPEPISIPSVDVVVIRSVEVPKKIRRVKLPTVKSGMIVGLPRGRPRIREMSSGAGEFGFVSVVFDGVRADGTAPWHREVLMGEGGEGDGEEEGDDDEQENEGGALDGEKQTGYNIRVSMKLDEDDDGHFYEEKRKRIENRLRRKVEGHACEGAWGKDKEFKEGYAVSDDLPRRV